MFLVAYADSLPVNTLDRAMWHSGQPVLVGRALHRILAGSGFRFTVTAILLALSLTVGWIVLGSLSRVAIVRAAASDLGVGADSGNRASWSVIFLNFLRAAVVLAALSVAAGSIILASSLLSSSHASSPEATLLVGLCWFLAWISWAFLNWLLSFIAVLTPLDRGGVSAFSFALQLLTRRMGAVFLIGILFGCCHFAALVAAWVATSTVLGLSGTVPLWGIAALGSVVALTYCALADFFYTGRLVSYIALLRPEESPTGDTLIVPPFLPGSVSVDKDELILSDASAPAI